MTNEEFLAELERTIKKASNGLASAVQTPPWPSQDECGEVLKDIESILRNAQRKSLSGRVYLPPQVLKLADQVAGVTVEKRVQILKEIRDHLNGTNLLCFDGREPAPWL
jgi:hypothetical protein